jgi:Zn-finger in Ran binding protein and others
MPAMYCDKYRHCRVVVAIAACLHIHTRACCDAIQQHNSIAAGNLRSLDLSGCAVAGLTAQGLGMKGSHITTLQLNNCAGITDAALRLIARGCPVLQTVSVLNCSAVTHHGAWQLTAHPTVQKCALQLQLALGSEPLPARVQAATAEQLAAATAAAIAAAAADHDAQWSCSVCTLFNAVSETQCEACGTERTAAAANGPAAVDAGAAAGADVLNGDDETVDSSNGQQLQKPYPLLSCSASSTLTSLHIDLAPMSSSSSSSSSSIRPPLVSVGRLALLLPAQLQELTLHACDISSSSSSSSGAAALIQCTAVDVQTLAHSCPLLQKLALIGQQTIVQVAGVDAAMHETAQAVVQLMPQLIQLQVTGVASLLPVAMLQAVAAANGGQVSFISTSTCSNTAYRKYRAHRSYINGCSG